MIMAIKLLWKPTASMATVVGISVYLLRSTDLVTDTGYLGLLSQFDGTAVSVLAAWSAIQLVSADAVRASTIQRRDTFLKLAAITALAGFVLSTISVHYKDLGVWATAANIVIVLAILWAISGSAREV